ncbi:MAG: hypothetical protein Q7S18_02350 [bacterium]|nr:hypothetical protein [bacterium]
MFSISVFIFVFPLALYDGFSILSANWIVAILAGFFGALGMIFFSGMLSIALPQNVSTLIVIMTLAQVVVTATYQIILNGQLSISKAVGYAAAAVAAYLLLR